MSAERTRLALRWAGHEGGASALEFAMLAPVFIAMLFGVVQIGWALHCGATLQYAVEQASRAVMLDPATSRATLESQVRQTMDAMATDGDKVNVTLTFETSSAGVTLARVGATYTQRVGVPNLATYDMVFNPEVLVPAE